MIDRCSRHETEKKWAEGRLHPDSLPRAILLDLDNTILVYDAFTEECWQEACRAFAPRIGVRDPDELVASVRVSRRLYWSDPDRSRQGRLNLLVARRAVVSMAFSRLGIECPIGAYNLADSYGLIKERTVKPYPGAIDTLKRFRNCGVRLALVTNGSSKLQRGKIERFGLTAYFDVILIEGEFNLGKPDERVFMHVLERLNVAATEAWMIGDNLEDDIAPSQTLGFCGVWVDWKGEGLPKSSLVRPDRIIRTLAELQNCSTSRIVHSAMVFRGHDT